MQSACTIYVQIIGLAIRTYVYYYYESYSQNVVLIMYILTCTHIYIYGFAVIEYNGFLRCEIKNFAKV